MTSLKKPTSMFRRLGQMLMTLSLTLGFLAAAGVAVVVGLDFLNERAKAAPSPEPANAVPVLVEPLQYETGYDIERRFVGQIESLRAVDLSFELSGRLTEILVDEGDRVTKGQPIASLDTELLQADRRRLIASRDALSAQLVFAEQQVTRNTRLTKDGFTSQQRQDQAVATRDELKARIAETEAAIAATDIRIGKSVLFAPFGGRVAQRVMDGGETLAAGQQILRLVDDASTTLRVGVPLEIDPTDLDGAIVEIGTQHIPARLASIRPDIDPVTRTRTVILALEGLSDMGLGRLATVVLTTRLEQTGFWVPADAVQAGRGSVWTVLMVDDTNTVRNAAVEILHAENDRLYVRGSFEDGANLIRTGPQRVTPGQSVRIIGDS